MNNRIHWLYRLKRLGRSCAPYLYPKTKITDMTCSELRAAVTRSHRHHQEFFAPDDDLQLGGLNFTEIDERLLERDGDEHLDLRYMKPLPGGKRVLAVIKRKNAELEDWEMTRVELWNIEGVPYCIWAYKGGSVFRFVDHLESEDVFTLFFSASTG